MKTATSPSTRLLILAAAAIIASLPSGRSRAAELRVGAATVSITPDRPVALQGQMNTRISKGVRSPVTATALALESREGDRAIDQAILVACDLVAIDRPVLDRARALLKDRLPGFDVRKLVVSATHTHTAPVYQEGMVPDPQGGGHAAGGIRRIPRRADRRGGGGRLEVAPGRPRRMGPRARGGRPEPSRRLCRRQGGDVRRHGQGRLPRHRGAGGPGRRGALLLGRRRRADRHGGERRLPVAGGRGGVDDRRRLLARDPPGPEGEARGRTSTSSAGRGPPATSRRT